jgi:hypothetical protein
MDVFGAIFFDERCFHVVKGRSSAIFRHGIWGVIRRGVRRIYERPLAALSSSSADMSPLESHRRSGKTRCHSLYGRVFVKRRERCSEHFLYSLSAHVA